MRYIKYVYILLLLPNLNQIKVIWAFESYKMDRKSNYTE